MVVLLLESHQTHVPFLWLYLAGFPLQSCQNDLNRSGDSSLYAAAVPWQPSVHELAPAGHVAHSVREVLLSARSRRYPRWHSPVQPKKLFDQRFRNICWSIASTERGEIPSASNPGICGDDTLSTCISAT